MDNKSKEPFGFNEVSTGELIDSPKFQEEQSKKKKNAQLKMIMKIHRQLYISPILHSNH